MHRTGKGLFTGIGIHGHCEAGSVAAVIQNRVQMYVQENQEDDAVTFNAVLIPPGYQKPWTLKLL